MTRFIFSTAFLIGAAAIIWMSTTFTGANNLALTVTIIIGFAYTIGAIELFQFRQQTASLTIALANTTDKVESLDNWLSRINAHLVNPVRTRIEGESNGLPAPVITPYLIGLLVMLGLLGTFLGMVDTLNGAVTALQGTTELQAIRAGLAAPIQGLGLAFGTSVAGVAASAMLGLMSTLSRRERILATEQLDTIIATTLREYSLAHTKKETYTALQVQATALPDVANKLNTLADKLVTMSNNIEQTLTAQQQVFHDSVSANYSELAQSIDKSLKETLAESGKLAGENIKPIIQTMMEEIKADTNNTHKTLTSTVQQELSELRSNWQVQQLEHDQAKLDQWTKSFDQLYLKTNEQFTNAGKQLAEELKQASGNQQNSVQNIANEFSKITNNLNEQWQQANQQTREQQHAITTSLTNSSTKLTEQLSASTEQSISQISKLIASSEALVKARAQSEQQWLENFEQHSQQLNEKLTEQLGSNTQNSIEAISKLIASSEDLVLTRTDTERTWLSQYEKRATQFNDTLQNALSQLRDDEDKRGQAALDRMAQLEDKVSSHLTTLGKGLEEPMSNLIAIASETPKAAAEVIGQLRNEISKNVAKENALLEERSGVMTELDKLSASLAQTATDQRESIELLVKSSEQILQSTSQQFDQKVDEEIGKLNDANIQFTGNSIEMTSLAEAFAQAVHKFDESNLNLIENLQRIEVSLEQNNNRTDEQLAYYVAQARDIIDHSIVSQKTMFDELRHIGESNQLAEVESA